MSRIEVTRDERLARLAASLVLCADRRQISDRRTGAARGGRRKTDPVPVRTSTVVWKYQRTPGQHVNRTAFRGAASKVQAKFRQICFTALSALQFALTAR